MDRIRISNSVHDAACVGSRHQCLTRVSRSPTFPFKLSPARAIAVGHVQRQHNSGLSRCEKRGCLIHAFLTASTNSRAAHTLQQRRTALPAMQSRRHNTAACGQRLRANPLDTSVLLPPLRHHIISLTRITTDSNTAAFTTTSSLSPYTMPWDSSTLQFLKM
jgi:hypothetical protein